MKKILIFTLALIMLAVNVFAAEIPELTVEEAKLKNITYAAFEMYIELYECSDAVSEKTSESICGIGLHEDLHCSSCDSVYGGMYYMRTDEYREYSSLVKLANSIFTEKVASDFIKYMHGFEHDGYVYSSPHLPSAQNDILFIEGGDRDMDFDKSFKIISQDEKCATVEFDVFIYEGFKIVSYTFDFVNTENGWRINGGTFVDNYFTYGRYYNKEYQAPQTGVDMFAYAAVAVVVLASVAVVVVKKKRA